MKKLLLVVVGLVLMSSTCLPTTRKTTNLKDLDVVEYLELNDNNGNVIVGSKYCTETTEYSYIYQLDNGMWVASNTVWAIGDRVKLMSVSKDTLNENSNTNK
jgi:hypothetical protein